MEQAPTSQQSVLHPLMRSPWNEEPPGPYRPVPKGFWNKIGQFLFDYNRY